MHLIKLNFFYFSVYFVLIMDINDALNFTSRMSVGIHVVASCLHAAAFSDTGLCRSALHCMASVWQ